MKKFLIITVFILLLVTVAESVMLFKVLNPPLPDGREDENAQKQEKIIELLPLSQYPSLPTGCEVTAAATVLRFYGENITPEQIAEDWLLKDEAFYTENGSLYGPDPRRAFVGDPFKTTGYGCFAPVIENAVNSGSALCRAEVIKDKSLSELCSLYIDNGAPVIIWVTMGMRSSGEGSRWQLSSGETFIWPAGEHCMVLCGYDEKYFHLSDPQSGSVVIYEKKLVERRFGELGNQAVIISPKDGSTRSGPIFNE